MGNHLIVNWGMHNYLISVLTALFYLIGLIGLLSKPLRFGFLILLWGYYFLIAHFVAPRIGHLVALLYIIGSIISIIISCRSRISNIIFSLFGYLLLVMVSYLYTIPFSLFGLSIEIISTGYMIPFLVLEITTISLVILIVRKLLFRSDIFSASVPLGNLQRPFFIQMLLSIGVILANIIYGSSLGYPSEVLTFNGILICFYVLSTITLFYSSYRTLRRNYELTLLHQEEKALNDYLERMEGFYEEVRCFRHDYKSILATLHCYIDNAQRQSHDNEELAALRTYFEKEILPSGLQLTSNGFLLGQLHYMEIPEIKSILYTKLLLAINHNLHINLELKEPISHINMDLIQLSRIIGILLDNSIDSAAKTYEALLRLSIINHRTAVFFIIENSTLSIEVPVSRLAEKGVTLKENHDGLGLYNVKKITDELPNVFYHYSGGKYFCQTLEIRKGD